MLFNSFEFLVFWIITTALYYLLPKPNQWLFLLLCSSVFYLFFKPIYIFILGFTIIVDYFAGIMIARAETLPQKRRYLAISIIANVGILATFKYLGFLHLPILLPIGLSFHTFQALSYTIEVFRGNQQPEKHFGRYALYVMFYPQLVAGPIERPQNLLPQIRPVSFESEHVKEGIKRMVWGLFKKIVIADRLSIIVNYVYSDPAEWHGAAIALTMICFAIQIYCDFSGYTDIALGAARVLGYNLMENFNHPFSSKSITEFWRRWHISLSTWFNDYLFKPIALKWRNLHAAGIVLAIMITFLVSGLWHGAGWTFIVFGALHGVAVATELLTKKFRKRLAQRLPPKLFAAGAMVLSFSFCCIAWIFFRADTMDKAFLMIRNLVSFTSVKDLLHLTEPDLYRTNPTYLGVSGWKFLYSMALIPLLFIIERMLANHKNFNFDTLPKGIRWSLYYLVIFAIIFLGVYDDTQFIYFQF